MQRFVRTASPFSDQPTYLIIKEVPREELEADDSDKVIGVFHFSKELQRTHGVPFKFVVKRVCPFCDIQSFIISYE